MIFTGNYRNCIGDNCVSISGDRGKSVNYTGRVYSKLAPKLSFWKIWHQNIGVLSEEENIRYYIENYYNLVLKNLDAKEVYNELDNTILLCYEENMEFCHRHIVAFWLEESLGIKVDEVKILKDETCIILQRPEYIKDILIDVMKIKY